MKTDFEYGERIEVSDYADFRNSCRHEFYAYQPKANFKFITRLGTFFKYARRPLPKLKKGQWILVKESDGRYAAREFIRFDGEFPVCILSLSIKLLKSITGCISSPEEFYTWRNGWKPLPGYDYNYDPGNGQGRD